MKNLVLAFCAVAFLALNVNAQIRTPQPSPAAKLEQSVGLTTITVEYSRPAMKDRVIFAADGLVPFGQIWRTGANAATKITFGDKVTIGGKELAAGSYAILSKPTAKEWEIMFYPYETSNFVAYVEQTPVVTAKALVKNLGHSVESFTIEVNNLMNESATLDFIWDNTMASLPIQLATDASVMASIERTMQGPSASDYFAAASYYHDAGKDLNKAFEWIQKANAENPQFWMLRREALIRADMGDLKGAIATAERSKKMAQDAGNQDYVRMNEKSIAEWSSTGVKGAKDMKKAEMKPKEKEKTEDQK